MEKEDYGLSFDVWGEKGCFTRPELQAERVTYPYITPSAARNIAQAIYWHPGIDYKIEEIQVLSPIQTKTVMRRERTDIIKPKIGLTPPVKEKLYTLRTTQYLVNPYYRIHLTFTLSDQALEKGLTPGKVRGIFKKRLKNGKCYTRPYLGSREFVAEFGPVNHEIQIPDSLKGQENHEIMTYDFDYDKGSGIRTPSYYMSHLKDGIVDLKDVKVLR